MCHLNKPLIFPFLLFALRQARLQPGKIPPGKGKRAHCHARFQAAARGEIKSQDSG
jgi:hypothetical protein